MKSLIDYYDIRSSTEYESELMSNCLGKLCKPDHLAGCKHDEPIFWSQHFASAFAPDHIAGREDIINRATLEIAKNPHNILQLDTSCQDHVFKAKVEIYNTKSTMYELGQEQHSGGDRLAAVNGTAARASKSWWLCYLSWRVEQHHEYP